MLKNPLTYEIMTPQSVGVQANSLVLGKHSGRHALGKRCEQLGFEFSRRDLDAIYKRFVAMADRLKTIEDRHLMQIVGEEFPALVGRARIAIPQADGWTESSFGND